MPFHTEEQQVGCDESGILVRILILPVAFVLNGMFLPLFPVTFAAGGA